jgi:hypothetical protein
VEIMKKITTTTTPVPRTDASLDAKLNPVEIGSDEIVAWGIAFPRSGPSVSRPLRAALISSSSDQSLPVWRTDATMGSVLGTAGRIAATPDDK